MNSVDIMMKTKSIAKLLRIITIIEEYQKVLGICCLRENFIQEFLEKNFLMLEPNYKRMFVKGDLRRYKMPEADFLMQTIEGRYVLIEIENPNDKLFTNETPPNPSKDLRNSMTQIMGYLSSLRNNLLFYRRYFPDITIENMEGLLVIGRSTRLSEAHKKAFVILNDNIREYKIITFDELFNRTQAFVNKIICHVQS